MVDETCVIWLNSLKAAGPQSVNWDRLVASYGPFIRSILRRRGLSADAIDDVAQNVMTIVFRRLPSFERRRTGSFRTWLRLITVNCVREYWRAVRHQRLEGDDRRISRLISELEDPRSDLVRRWNREHAQHTLAVLLEQVAHEFSTPTLEAFQRLAVREEAVSDVAHDLGITPNACYIARSRVLHRLRERLQQRLADDRAG